MQMDAYLKKEQIGTLFVWVGAPEGGGRGWVVGQGGPAQKMGMPVQNAFWAPPDSLVKYLESCLSLLSCCCIPGYGITPLH